jgi:hypothetical protein
MSAHRIQGSQIAQAVTNHLLAELALIRVFIRAIQSTHNQGTVNTLNLAFTRPDYQR